VCSSDLFASTDLRLNMAQPLSKERSTQDDNKGLKQREYRDEQGRVHHHTRKYMERGGEASQSDERQDRHRDSRPSRKRRSEPSHRGFRLGNFAQSIADRPALLLAAAAAAGTFLISRWLGESGWRRRSFGRYDDSFERYDDDSFGRDDEERFIPGASWAEAQVRANRNESRPHNYAQHTGYEQANRGGVGSEAGFEGTKASQQEAVAQAGGQKPGLPPVGQGTA